MQRETTTFRDTISTLWIIPISTMAAYSIIVFSQIVAVCRRIDDEYVFNHIDLLG
jgi:hypothetical protein